jgi:hypothetical protein
MASSLANGEMAARKTPYSIFLEYLDKEANFYQVIKRAGDRRRARDGALIDGRSFAHQTLQPGRKQKRLVKTCLCSAKRSEGQSREMANQLLWDARVMRVCGSR